MAIPRCFFAGVFKVGPVHSDVVASCRPGAVCTLLCSTPLSIVTVTVVTCSVVSQSSLFSVFQGVRCRVFLLMPLFHPGFDAKSLAEFVAVTLINAVLATFVASMLQPCSILSIIWRSSSMVQSELVCFVFNRAPRHDAWSRPQDAKSPTAHHSLQPVLHMEENVHGELVPCRHPSDPSAC